MCKGRHLEWYEIKIGMLLRAFGFTDSIISSALGVHKVSFEERLEKIVEKTIQGDTQDIEELFTIIRTILENENSYITKKFKELFKKCYEMRKAKCEMLKEMYRRRCQEI